MSNVVRYDVDGNAIKSSSEPVDRISFYTNDPSDVGEIARAVIQLSEQIQHLATRLPPRAREYEIDGFAGTSSDSVVINHGFSNRVRWWLVNAVSSGPVLAWETADSTNDQLILSFDNSANTPSLVTVRVEVAS